MIRINGEDVCTLLRRVARGEGASLKSKGLNRTPDSIALGDIQGWEISSGRRLQRVSSSSVLAPAPARITTPAEPPLEEGRRRRRPGRRSLAGSSSPSFDRHVSASALGRFPLFFAWVCAPLLTKTPSSKQLKCLSTPPAFVPNALGGRSAGGPFVVGRRRAGCWT